MSGASLASNSSSPFVSWKVEHAAIRVPDLDTAVAWYSEKLDFRLLRSWQLPGKKIGWISPIANDGFIFELIAGPGADDRPAYEDLGSSYKVSGWHHTAFQVESVDNTVVELKRRGVTIVSEPHDLAEIRSRAAFFADLWGNLFEVMQVISS